MRRRYVGPAVALRRIGQGVALAALATLLSCTRTVEIRQYEEIVIVPSAIDQAFSGSGLNVVPGARATESLVVPEQAPLGGSGSRTGSGGSAAASAAPVAGGARITFATPDHWRELPGDSLRLAVFSVPPTDGGTAQPEEWTLVLLGGAAGGVRANVERWLGQLGLGADAALVDRFVAESQTLTSSGGFEVAVFGFTGVTDQGASSMLTAIVPIAGQTAFLKLAGGHEIVARERDAFVRLAATLELAINDRNTYRRG